MMSLIAISFFFFFNDTATTEIYTLSLHDALPIYLSVLDNGDRAVLVEDRLAPPLEVDDREPAHGKPGSRSEEHTSELQSRQYLVCRLLLEKKKINKICPAIHTNSHQSLHDIQLSL